MVVNLLLVAAGGFFGAICRFAVNNWSRRRFASPFPYGTLLVNVTGSFLLGLLLGIEAPVYWQKLQLFGGIGFLGAYTTYSTFASESLQLASNGYTGKFLVYQVVSYGLGIGGAAAGYAAGVAMQLH